MRTRTDPRNGDPRLKTRQWKAIVTAWNRTQPTTCQATPCQLPNHPITYTPTRTRTSLDVGHLIPRAIDTRHTWTIEDTRPEHAYCSRSHGTKIKQMIKKPTNRPEQAKSANKW